MSSALYLLEPELKRLAIAPQLIVPQKSLQTSPIVLADPVALEQIIHNLLMNALQALGQVSAAERQLVVKLAAQGSLGLTIVLDTGPGIAPSILPRIFEPFFTSREGGLGLGLSLCETLANTMGGRLQVANHMPRGAVFTLSLPLAGNP